MSSTFLYVRENLVNYIRKTWISSGVELSNSPSNGDRHNPLLVMIFRMKHQIKYRLSLEYSTFLHLLIPLRTEKEKNSNVCGGGPT